jgi:hypothetical protein
MLVHWGFALSVEGALWDTRFDELDELLKSEERKERQR